MSSDFPVIPTTIDSSSESFIKCRNEWTDVLAAHTEAVRWCVSEGEDKYVNRHVARGMLLCIPLHSQPLTSSKRQNKYATRSRYSLPGTLSLCRIPTTRF